MKSILVHLDASPRAAMRLGLAQRLARRHGARLTALYGVLPWLLATPWAAGEGMAVAATMAADLDLEQRERARALFDKATEAGPIEWVDAGAAPYRTLLHDAPYQDLLVLGQHDAGDALTGALPPDMVASAITDTGRPVLVVPHSGIFESLPQRVLIAWKPTREATNAVHAALPFLRAAKQVEVAHPHEPGAAGSGAGVALCRWLQLQGVAAAVQLHPLRSQEVGDSLLSLAADGGADLLVMGCYGHRRTREWVFGGTTRTVLATMTLPVLMAH